MGKPKLRLRRILTALLALLCLIPAGKIFAASQSWGQRVVAIELKTDPPVPLRDFATDIVQQVSQPLDEGKISESLKRLYATGRFVELRANAEPGPGGVIVVFSGKAQYFIGAINIVGAPRAFSEASLADATRLRLGEPFTTATLAAAMRRLKSALAQSGYEEARVGYAIHRRPDDQLVNLSFTIFSGRHAKIAEVVFSGSQVFPAALLRRKMGWKAGKSVNSSALARSVAKLHQFYLRRGYPEAVIRIAKRSYQPRTNLETFVVEVRAGPQVQVEVEGAPISAARLRTLLPVYTEGIADRASLEAGARDLEDYFERQGYFQASVRLASVDRNHPQRLDIVYRAVRGPHGQMEGFSFAGNAYISTAELSPLVSIRRPGAFSRSLYSRRMLAADVQNLLALYHARGFLHARVTPEILRDYNGFRGDIFVKFQIVEGLLTTSAAVEVAGLGPSLEQGVRALLSNRIGKPYSTANCARDREMILTYLANRGYRDAVVSWKVERAAPHRVNVQYVVKPGPRTIIRRVVVVGNRHTRENVILRELSLSPQQPYNESQAFGSEQRLYNLGVFNQVRIGEEAPAGSDPEKTVLVDVEEARRWTIGYGAGMDVQRLGSNQPQGQYKVSPRVSLDVTRLNVGGRAQTADLRSQYSTLEKSLSFSYLMPRIGGRSDLDLRFTALFDESANVLTFTARRAEVGVTLEKRFSPQAFVSASFNYRNVQALDLSNTISLDQIPLLSQPARIGMFSLSYANDRRNNPIDATRGSYSVANGGLSWTGFGSEANFARFYAENATYYPLTHWLTFARDTRFGFESPYGGTYSIQIPLPERFFMGGSESHRGFSINQAGPRDPETGFPIGGNALFLNSLELRMRIAQDRLGIVLFHDMGNVYSSVRRMRLFKFTQSPVSQVPEDFDYTVHAVGAGILYNTPVGPLRFEVGYDLNPPRFNVHSATGVTVERLPHFNYFISVGQSF